jgi:hypothetical protein
MRHFSGIILFLLLHLEFQASAQFGGGLGMPMPGMGSGVGRAGSLPRTMPLNSTSFRTIPLFRDSSGIFFQQVEVALGTSPNSQVNQGGIPILIKQGFDRQEKFVQVYKKELKKKRFLSFIHIQNRLFAICSEYRKSDAVHRILGAEISKESGEFISSWKQMASIKRNNKNERFQFSVSYNRNRSAMVAILVTQQPEKSTYRILEYGESLKPVKQPVTIIDDFKASNFRMENFYYTASQEIIQIGKVFKTDSVTLKPVFSSYAIRVFDALGNLLYHTTDGLQFQQLSRINILKTPEGAYVIRAYYFNSIKNTQPDGRLEISFNPNTGERLSLINIPFLST